MISYITSYPKVADRRLFLSILQRAVHPVNYDLVIDLFSITDVRQHFQGVPACSVCNTWNTSVISVIEGFLKDKTPFNLSAC